MTGQPVFSLSTKSMSTDSIWSLLGSLDKKKYVISTACFSGANGLVAGHAYTIIGVTTVTLPNNGGYQRLVKARNPWGSEKYTGKWSDKSDLWTDAMRNQAGSVMANDGIFFIPIEEYKIDFSGI